MHKNTVIISLAFLLTGFISAYVIFGSTKQNDSPADSIAVPFADDDSVPNPFIVKEYDTQDTNRLTRLENELASVKKQIYEISQTLQDLTKNSNTDSVIAHPEEMNRQRLTSMLTQRLYSLDNLVKGGIDSSRAEDIVRRKNSVELKRMALQDRATRDNFLNTQRYFDELEEINKQDISLREELGDDRYDEYLFTSKQNNRIRISSVMLGSAAEQAGIQKGDIVISYNNSRMFSWQELKDATSEGSLGEFVSLSIYRRGEIYSYSVPRGPLGVQLGATRLAP